MQMWGATAVGRRGALLLVAVAGLGVGGCLDPDGLSSTTSATSATTGGGVSSAATGEATSSGSTSAATGDATSGAGLLCPVGQVYRCNLPETDEVGYDCGPGSGCVDAPGCVEDSCAEPWAAVDANDGVVSCALDPSAWCDLWAQDCGEFAKCVPWNDDPDYGGSWDASRCAPLVFDPVPAGAACQVYAEGTRGLDNCGGNGICLFVGLDDQGTCVAQCDGAPDNPTCAEGHLCHINGSGVTQLCLPMCDPLADDCGSGSVCLPHWQGFFCDYDASGDYGVYGDPCEYANACDPGLACLSSQYVPDCEASGCCTPFCETTAENTCPGAEQGQVCIPWFEAGMIPEGYEALGVCGIPL